MVNADHDHSRCREILDHSEDTDREYRGQDACQDQQRRQDKISRPDPFPSVIPCVDKLLYIIKI